jgi:hypothetical protein
VGTSAIAIQKSILEVINAQSEACSQLDSIANYTSSSNSFYLKLRKNYVTKEKLTGFIAHQSEPTILLGPLLHNMQLDQLLHEKLQNKFWENSEFLQNLKQSEKPQIVFIANNDLSGISSEQLSEFTSFFLDAKNILLIVWDADNHHWSMLSTVLCLASDFYFPAHLERISYFQSLNPFVPQVVPLGSCQWPIDLLVQNSELIVNSQRSDGPWGQHQFYPKFEMRNALVKTVSEAYPQVGFISSGSRLASPFDSLMQWAGYKTHFCACVGGDMPYRVFDGLLTGGVVIVPTEMQNYFKCFRLPEERVVYYTAADIFDMTHLIKRALSVFGHASLTKSAYIDGIRKFHISRFGHMILNHISKHLSESLPIS